MAIDMTLDEMLDEIARWDPAELWWLREWGAVIVGANIQDNMEAVEKLSLALLEHGDNMPAYYKAQAYAWLSTCEGYDRVEYTQQAAFWILEARPERPYLGFSKADLKEWTNLIWEHKDAAMEEANKERGAKPQDDGPRDGQPASSEPQQLTLPLRRSTAAPTTAVSNTSASGIVGDAETAVQRIHAIAKATTGTKKASGRGGTAPGGGFGMVEPGKVVSQSRALSIV